MATFTLSAEYDLGGYLPDQPNGNLIGQVTAEQDDTGAWHVVTRDGAGVEMSRRDATADEAAALDAALTVAGT